MRQLHIIQSLDVTHMQFVYTLQSLDNINFSNILAFILSEFDLKFTAIGTIKSQNVEN